MAKDTYWNVQIRNLDPLEKRAMIKNWYNSITDWNAYILWVSGNGTNPNPELFTNPKSFHKFMLECARNNFDGAKRRIIELNEIMHVFNGNESTYF